MPPHVVRAILVKRGDGYITGRFLTLPLVDEREAREMIKRYFPGWRIKKLWTTDNRHFPDNLNA